MKKLAAVFLLVAALNSIGAQTAPTDSAPAENQLKLDAPPPAQDGASGSGNPLRENERNYAFVDNPDSLQGGVSIWSVLRIFIVLILVALAIYGIIYFLKKSRTKGTTEERHLKILAALPLNTRNAAAVISVGNKAWLVGLSDSSVSLISEITDQETVSAMLLDYSEHAALNTTGKAANFMALLQRFIPPDSKTAAPGTPPDTNDKLRKNRDKLRGL
ncbi:MAG: flagellar biosynthetic protein FliO [Spirochaetaceae bacterium]|jgi:flagellar protein FliO/FliZ|nr:flagellar biosynthetic protein FliO [Spirochaetaceae bacterium]